MSKEIKIEKIPSLICPICGSTYVMMTEEGPHCDDCNRVTVGCNKIKDKNIIRDLTLLIDDYKED